MELTVVQRSLEVAYNRAWEQGIRVLILATTFKEDLAMVHYPYQPASRSLTRHFLDPMGRKIPLMDDMLDLMWEDGATQDTYIFTNADIAVIPDFYMDCWTIYRSDTAVPVLLREQLPLEAIDLTRTCRYPLLSCMPSYTACHRVTTETLILSLSNQALSSQCSC